MAIAPNGDLIVAGDRSGASVVRFGANGEPRLGFGVRGTVTLEGYRSKLPRLGKAETVDVLPGGRILVDGVNRKQMTVVALTPHGRPVRKFGKERSVSRRVRKISVIEDLRAGSRGSIFAADSTRKRCVIFRIYCHQSVMAARLNRKGRFVRGFGRRGVLLRSVGKKSAATAILSGRRGITVAGFAEVPGQRRQFMLMRLRR